MTRVKLTKMSKSLGLFVAVVINSTILGLRAMEMHQFDQSLSIGEEVRRVALGSLDGVPFGTWVPDEIQGYVISLDRAQELHAQRFLVPFQTGFGVFDADGGMVEAVGFNVSGGLVSGGLVVLGHEFDLVSIRVESESAMGEALFEFLVPLDAQAVEAFARGLDVVDGDADVAETEGVCVSGVRFVLGIALGAVVVCQFEKAFTVGTLFAGGFGGREVVAEEVEVEFGVWIGHLGELFQAELRVEGHRTVRVFNTDHGVVHLPLVVIWAGHPGGCGAECTGNGFG